MKMAKHFAFRAASLNINVPILSDVNGGLVHHSQELHGREGNQWIVISIRVSRSTVYLQDAIFLERILPVEDDALGGEEDGTHEVGVVAHVFVSLSLGVHKANLHSGKLLQGR